MEDGSVAYRRPPPSKIVSHLPPHNLTTSSWSPPGGVDLRPKLDPGSAPPKTVFWTPPDPPNGPQGGLPTYYRGGPPPDPQIGPKPPKPRNRPIWTPQGPNLARISLKGAKRVTCPKPPKPRFGPNLTKLRGFDPPRVVGGDPPWDP